MEELTPCASDNSCVCVRVQTVVRSMRECVQQATFATRFRLAMHQVVTLGADSFECKTKLKLNQDENEFYSNA